VTFSSAIDMIRVIASRIGGNRCVFGNIRSLAVDILPTLRLLDLGSGHPYFIAACSSLGMHCRGVDLEDGNTIRFSFLIFYLFTFTSICFSH